MNSTLTIRNLIPDSDPGTWMLSRFSDTTAGRRLKAIVPSVAFDNLTTLLADQVDKLLDMNLIGLFVEAWLKHRELRTLTANQGEGELVALIDHGMSSVHEPKVEVMLDGKRVFTVSVSIDFELQFKGVQLLVQDRRVREVQLGELEGTGSLTIEGQPLAQQSLGTVELPGTVRLDPGIPLVT